MTYSPLPLKLRPYSDRWEYPCIIASTDGYNWVTPIGLQNPIDDLTSEEIDNCDYFSDPHLVYNWLYCIKGRFILYASFSIVIIELFMS